MALVYQTKDDDGTLAIVTCTQDGGRTCVEVEHISVIDQVAEAWLRSKDKKERIRLFKQYESLTEGNKQYNMYIVEPPKTKGGKR